MRSRGFWSGQTIKQRGELACLAGLRSLGRRRLIKRSGLRCSGWGGTGHERNACRNQAGMLHGPRVRSDARLVQRWSRRIMGLRSRSRRCGGIRLRYRHGGGRNVRLCRRHVGLRRMGLRRMGLRRMGLRRVGLRRVGLSQWGLMRVRVRRM